MIKIELTEKEIEEAVKYYANGKIVRHSDKTIVGVSIPHETTITIALDDPEPIADGLEEQ